MANSTVKVVCPECGRKVGAFKRADLTHWQLDPHSGNVKGKACKVSGEHVTANRFKSFLSGHR